MVLAELKQMLFDNEEMFMSAKVPIRNAIICVPEK